MEEVALRILFTEFLISTKSIHSVVAIQETLMYQASCGAFRGDIDRWASAWGALALLGGSNWATGDQGSKRAEYRPQGQLSHQKPFPREA